MSWLLLLLGQCPPPPPLDGAWRCCELVRWTVATPETAGHFAGCMSGPCVMRGVPCTSLYDFDRDADVDLADLAEWHHRELSVGE